VTDAGECRISVVARGRGTDGEVGKAGVRRVQRELCGFSERISPARRIGYVRGGLSAHAHVLVNGEEVAGGDAAEFACFVGWDSACDWEDGRQDAAVLVWWRRGAEDSKTTRPLRDGDKVTVRFSELP